jgi:DHA1 family bicyclomycin/chloramphenicol resistance-like MFS transporter
MTFAAIMNLWFNFAEWETAFTLCFFYSFAALGAGIFTPVLVNGALQNFPEKAGTASSLMGCIQMLGAAFGSALLGAIYDNSARPMVIVIVVCTALMFGLYSLLIPRGGYSAAK